MLDLTGPEIKLIAEVAATAISDADLEPIADAISRPRLDGNVLDKQTFAALVPPVNDQRAAAEGHARKHLDRRHRPARWQ